MDRLTVLTSPDLIFTEYPQEISPLITAASTIALSMSQICASPALLAAHSLAQPCELQRLVRHLL
jgi:hypothetical protein